jgi:hypothetical protein
VVLTNLALAEAALGQWADAIGDATEGLRLARDTGQPATAAYFVVMLAAVAAEDAAIALLATGTMVEAAARADRLDGLEAHVARFERWARWDRRTWTQLVAQPVGAPWSPRGPAAERHYLAALAVDGAGRTH